MNTGLQGFPLCFLVSGTARSACGAIVGRQSHAGGGDAAGIWNAGGAPALLVAAVASGLLVAVFASGLRLRRLS